MDGSPPHVRLANDVALHLAHRGPDEAARAVAHHIRAFWDPRMRTALLEHTAAGGEGLDPIALRAAELLDPAGVS
ncbi:formate dehydrogenase subunit delta [Pseudonocardia sp. DLS-67]